MKTKILVAIAIGTISALLFSNHSTNFINSDLVFKEKNTNIKTRIIKTIDSDLDGVTDDRDKCPNTPMGVVVDASGCPVIKQGSSIVANKNVRKTNATLKIKTINSDLDSMSEDRGKYSNTRLGIIDSDGDGIPDKYDCCPGTPAGTIVNSCGCPIDFIV